ncbi:hypothetical protein SAMN05444359_12730 [Neolewinella agarilytica]|uniref:Uncharacterized protein n=1 Tax=Neolewinella agarilytica TaxID=478744 RepID=A0A1H9M7H0_9BACT|nr:hypothetical protein SAMN05444359_12730 [Neolewinella agarilytica]
MINAFGWKWALDTLMGVNFEGKEKPFAEQIINSSLLFTSESFRFEDYV